MGAHDQQLNIKGCSPGWFLSLRYPLYNTVVLGASGPSLRDTVRGLLDSLRKNIVLDLSGVTYFDSFGLGHLIASNVEATSQGGAIKLLNLNKKIQDLMLLTKLYTVFAIYTDESTALMSFDVAPSHS